MNWFKEFWKALTVPMPVQSQDSSEVRNNFTPRAQQVLALAHKEADRFRHNFIGTEHLLLGIIRLGQGVAVNVLGNMGLNLETVRLEVERFVGAGPDEKFSGHTPYTPRVKKVLALAAMEARALNHTYVGTEHILLGLLREGDGVAGRVLRDLDVDPDVTRQEILKELDPNFQPPVQETCIADTPALPDSTKAQPDLVDGGKRYDVYCLERDQQVVYRNVIFKGRKKIFPEDKSSISSEFIELEQADGQTVFVARSSIVKFCEHRATASSGEGPAPKP